MSDVTQATTLVVMAAGMGSRYGGLKQIDPVGPSGEIIIDYSVYDAIQNGFTDVVFVIRESFANEFKHIIEPHFGDKVRIHYVYQDIQDIPETTITVPHREKPWGTAHAIYTCRHCVSSPFAVINADDFYGRGAFQLLAGKLNALAHTEHQHLLLGYKLKNTLSPHGPVKRGICRFNEKHILTGMAEYSQIEMINGALSYSKNGKFDALSENDIASMNLWGFTPSIFDHLETEFQAFLSGIEQRPKSEFQIPTAIDNLIQKEKIQVNILETDEKWLGVTYPEDKQPVEQGILELVDKHIYPHDLWRN